MRGIDKIHFRQRSFKATLIYALKISSLLLLFFGVSNIGFVFATHQYDNLREVLGIADYNIFISWFLNLRESPIIPSTGIALIVFVVLLAAHFFIFGPKDMRPQGVDDEIGWWNLGERVNHAIVAVVFLVLLVTGLLITFGRYFSEPIFGVFVRQSHEFAGFVFTPFLLFMIAQWVKHALPRGYDIQWLARVGGYLGYKGRLQAGKFNAGQKIWYWIMAIGGIVLAVTGFGLIFDVGQMYHDRLFVLLHFYVSMPVIFMFLIHIYLTTIGVKGVFSSMVHGKIGKTGAMQYHSEAEGLK